MQYNKAILSLFLILSGMLLYAQDFDSLHTAASTQISSISCTVSKMHKIKVYVSIDFPTFSFDTDKNTKVNPLQGGGVAAELLFNNRMSLYLNASIFKKNYRIDDNYQIGKAVNIEPMLRVYLDQYAKLFAGVGANIGFYEEILHTSTQDLQQRYVQGRLIVGFGYKMYMFKKKHFGVEAFMGGAMGLWSNSEDWTSALFRRGFVYRIAFFYKIEPKKK